MAGERPRFRSAPTPVGSVTDPDGATLGEAEALVATFADADMPAFLRKTPAGLAALFFTALAVVLADTRPPEEHEAVIAGCPDVLRDSVRHVLAERARIAAEGSA